VTTTGTGELLGVAPPSKALLSSEDVDDGVVAAGAVGLERLGGLVVVPAAALGEIAEGEPAARRQGHRGAAGAVSAEP
jgi:hypothetical protein